MSTTEKEVKKDGTCSTSQCSTSQEDLKAKLAREAEIKQAQEAQKKAKGSCNCG